MGYKTLKILRKFGILDFINHIYFIRLNQSFGEVKFPKKWNSISSNEKKREEEKRERGKKWTKREWDQGYRCSGRLFLNATSSKTERSFFRRMYSRDVSSIHPATRTTIASTLLFLVTCANYATLHAETERLHAASLKSFFHSSLPPEIP